MYPKLKVKRSQEQDVGYRGGIDPSLPGLKALDSLLHGEISSSAKKEIRKPVSKKLEAEEPSPCNLGSIPPFSASKDKNDRVEEDIRTHIRASPIPRPRAVLSSPVNDVIIGTKMKRTEERKPRQSNHRCNVATKPSANGRPRNGHQVSKEAAKPCQLSAKVTNCSATVKHSAADRHRNGRVVPEDTLSKSVNAACKGSVVPIAFKIKD